MRRSAVRALVYLAGVQLSAGCVQEPAREPLEPCLPCEDTPPGASTTERPWSRPTTFDGSRATTLFEDRFETKTIGSPAPRAPARPKRAKKVRIELKQAPFDEAVQLLADAGRFNVVVEAPGATAVTASLRDVEPYDALVSFVEARGLSVRYERGIVIVSR